MVDLIGADIIVSVGRGISRDVEKGIALAEELAQVPGAGGVVGGSRAVIDAGWLSADPHDRPDRKKPFIPGFTWVENIRARI